MQHDTMYLQNSSDLVPFEESRYRYSFEERCQESSLFYLEDGRYTVFLSTKGTNEEVGWEALIKFLKFVGAGLEKSTAGKIDGTVYRGYFLGFSCIKSSSILSRQFWHFFKEKILVHNGVQCRKSLDKRCACLRKQNHHFCDSANVLPERWPLTTEQVIAKQVRNSDPKQGRNPAELDF